MIIELGMKIGIVDLLSKIPTESTTLPIAFKPQLVTLANTCKLTISLNYHSFSWYNKPNYRVKVL